jgi:hypothetical protein
VSSASSITFRSFFLLSFFLSFFLSLFLSRLTVSCILKDDDSFSNYHYSLIEQLIQQPPGIVSRRMKLSWLYDQIYSNSNSNSNSNGGINSSQHSRKPSGENTPIEPGTPLTPASLLSTSTSTIPSASTAAVKRIQLLLLSFIIQKTFHNECEKIENNDWNRFFLPLNSSSYLPKVFQSLSSSSSSSSSISSNANNVSLASQSGTSVSGVQSLPNNMGPALPGNYYVNPTTIRGLILPKPFSDKDFKVFYTTGSIAGFKVRWLIFLSSCVSLLIIFCSLLFFFFSLFFFDFFLPTSLYASVIHVKVIPLILYFYNLIVFMIYDRLLPAISLSLVEEVEEEEIVTVGWLHQHHE